MAKLKAMVDPALCDAGMCDNGVCAALASCPHRILKQEAPGEMPFVAGNASLCRGCFKCLAACPAKAIKKIES